MGTVQREVEDGRGWHLVPGERLGPVAEDLVRGDDHGARDIAVTNPPEEQAASLFITAPCPTTHN